MTELWARRERNYGQFLAQLKARKSNLFFLGKCSIASKISRIFVIGSLLVVLSYDKGHELRGNLCRSDCGRVLDSWSVFTSALTQKCITIESHVEPLLAADYSMSSQGQQATRAFQVCQEAFCAWKKWKEATWRNKPISTSVANTKHEAYLCAYGSGPRLSKGEIGLRKTSPNVVPAEEKSGVMRLNRRVRTQSNFRPRPVTTVVCK
jgi:hypothetical protein